MKLFRLLLSIISVLSLTQVLACGFDGNETNAGTLTPTGAYQTVTNVANGNYYVINVNCGDTYNFNFCNNGGTAGWDTQLTILETNGTTELSYNDDNCGLQSQVTWTATFTGTVYVLVSEYFCNNLGDFTGATMAYNVTAGTPQDASFTIASNGCTGATATITGDTGGTFSFNPAPGDAAVINPTTGEITNGTGGATYTVEYTVNCGVSTTQNVTLPAAGDPTFSLTVACGGGTATVTGDAGGTFSFNPAPGDGAQVNASTGLVTNGTAGTTYFVEYSVCGSTSIESVTVLTDDCWTLNGDASYITVGGEQCIELTPELNGMTGCAWNGSQIDFASDFTLTLDYYFGNNINGADGNTFTFQTSSSSACGTNGGQLGAGGMSNALSIEFDTYDNDNPAHIYDMLCDHVAVEIDGNMQGPGAPLCGPVCAKSSGGNIDDGGTYTVDIQWDATSQQLDIYFDGALRLSCTNDFVTNAFSGNNMVYWGATSATGGLNNQQYFCPSTVIVLPAELTSFESSCNNDREVFTWKTASESRLDHFQLEYTLDGLTFFPVGKIQATGNTQEAQDYSLEQLSSDDKPRYYRLKIVDIDGGFEYSDLIASKNCVVADGIFNAISTSATHVAVDMKVPAYLSIYDQFGKLVAHSKNGLKHHTFETSTLENGIYLIEATTLGGKREVKRQAIVR